MPREKLTAASPGQRRRSLSLCAEAAAMNPPARHWAILWQRAVADSPEAVDDPFAEFPSWFLRIECDRCGKVVMHNEVHMTDRQRAIVLRVLLSRMRHDGCGGRAAIRCRSRN